MKTKICSRCNIEKSVNEFNKYKQAKDGYQAYCRECSKLYRLERKKTFRPIIPNMKVCVKCGIEKAACDFNKNNDHRDGLYIFCKECEKIKGLEYRQTPEGKASAKRNRNKRRGFGHAPLNDWFEGSHFHHLHINGDHAIGIYIPKELHQSIWHSSYSWKNMDWMNLLAYTYLYEQIKRRNNYDTNSR
jgi:hypothetical protein